MRDALPHAARTARARAWRRRPAAGPARAAPAPGPPLALADALQAQRELDVLRGGEPGQQRRLLEHQRRPRPGTSTVPSSARRAGDEVEQRRLAAAGGAEQADELALRRPQADVVEHERAVPEALA
jgi:hypothetical protein